MLPKFSSGIKEKFDKKTVSQAMSRWSVDEGMKKKFLAWEKGENPEREDIEGEAKQQIEKQQTEAMQQAERQRAAQRLRENIEQVRAYKERLKMRKMRGRSLAGAAGKLAWNIFGYSKTKDLSEIQKAQIRKQEGSSQAKA